MIAILKMLVGDAATDLGDARGLLQRQCIGPLVGEQVDRGLQQLGTGLLGITGTGFAWGALFHRQRRKYSLVNLAGRGPTATLCPVFVRSEGRRVGEEGVRKCK